MRIRFLVAILLASVCVGGLQASGIVSAQFGHPVETVVRVSEESFDVGEKYFAESRQVALRRVADLVAAKFRPGERPEEILAAVPSLRGASLEHRPPRDDVRIIRLPDKGPAAVHAALSALKSRAEIESASPVYLDPRGIRLVATDTLAAKRAQGVSEPAFIGTVARYGLRIEEKLPHTSDQFLLRLTNPKTSDILQVAEQLRESGVVSWVEPDFLVELRPHGIPNDSLFGLQWQHHNTGQTGGLPDADIDTPAAWDVETGRPSTVIAIVDDGVERSHEDLAANIWVNPGEIPGNNKDDDGNGYKDDVNGWNFVNRNGNVDPIDADDMHGTSTAGMAAAVGNNGIGVAGASWSSKIMPIKIVRGSLWASYSTIATAIRYAASYADVISNSWGGGDSAEVHSAIQDAVTLGRGGKGCPVLVSSGNEATGYVTYMLTGFPPGTYTFRWEYVKNASLSMGDDAVWIDDIVFPGGERETFESGIPAGWSVGGNAPWTTGTARVNSGTGSTRAARSGVIGGNQSSYMQVTKAVGSGDLVFQAWVSSEPNGDYFDLYVSGTRYFHSSGVPTVTTTVSYPARYVEAIAVGASSDCDFRSEYSCYGADLDVVAPSSGGWSEVWTTDRTGSAGYSAGNYTGFGGTSASCPLAAGVVALLLSRRPELTEAQVREMLQDTADKIGGYTYVGGRSNYTGYGRVNAANLLLRLPDSIGAAKLLPDKTLVSLSSRVVSANFGSHFYIEESDRSSGIRVNAAGPAPGTTVSVYGRIDTVDGERTIRDASVTVGSTAPIPDPVMVPNRWLGWSGLSNTGLLVTVAGRVVHVGQGFCYIDDGSSADDSSGYPGIRVETTQLSPGKLPFGSYALITGISGVHMLGSVPVPVLRPRGDADVTFPSP